MPLFFLVVGVIAGALFLLWLIIYTGPQLFGYALHRVATTEKVVALTFDDGPATPFTNAILALLKKHEVPATFFVIGQHAQQYPEIVQALYGAGHEVGNHTWSHPLCLAKSPSFLREEIEKTDNLLHSLGYTKEIYFRVPYGIKFLILPWVLSQLHKKNILFDVVPWDWVRPGIEKIVKRVLRRTRPGSIILLHDGFLANDSSCDREQTVAATDIIIQELKEKGYRFVTITELLTFRSK